MLQSHFVTRLAIDLNTIGEDYCSSSTSDGKSEYFTCRWFDGRLFDRLSTFHLKQQQVVTFERCQVSETRPELFYNVRVLTPSDDLQKELTVPV